MEFVLLLIAIAFTLVAQTKIQSTYHRYSQVRNRHGFTGEQVAQQMLMNAGIYDVRVERIGGNLTDHYDPRNKVLRLSSGVYDSTSVAALGIAAHETGHAIQHDVGYLPLVLRSMMVPATNICSRMAMPLIIIGLLFSSQSGNALITVGILFFAVAVLFSFVTLPVEFNASKRALQLLEDYNFLDGEEIYGAKKVLSAAAMTYVAAAAVALAQLLRLLAIFGRRND